MDKIKSLTKQLNEASENLSEENKKTFGDIIVYVRASNIKSMDAEEFLQQLLDSFLNAEQRGVSIESVLGTTDIKHYCDEIINTYKANYNFLSLYSEYITYSGIAIGILSALDYFFGSLRKVTKHGFNSLTLSSNFTLATIFQFLFIGGTVVVIMSYIKKSCFTKDVPTGKVKNFFKFWGIGILWFTPMLLSSKFLDKIVLFQLNIILVLIISVALYFIGNYLSQN